MLHYHGALDPFPVFRPLHVVGPCHGVGCLGDSLRKAVSFSCETLRILHASLGAFTKWL